MGLQDRTVHSFWIMYGAALLIAAAGFMIAYRFVGPPPPRHLRLAAGARDGAYYAFGQRYAAFMAKRGITLEVMETAGSVENLHLLQDRTAGVDVALVQGGVDGGGESRTLAGLGAVSFEPLWVFVRADASEKRLLADLRGKVLAIGAEGSGTRALAMKVLGASGVNAGNSRLMPLTGTNAVNALLAGEVDALFTVAAVEAGSLQRLIADDRLKPLDLVGAEAYARHFRFLSAVRLPAGVLDLARHRPSSDLWAVSPCAMLVAREGLHPALADLLLQAAASAHASGDLLSEPGQFPSKRYLDFPLSKDAERFYKYGPPFLQRFLPFWVATTVDRIKVLIVPLLVLLLPLVKIVPPAFRWRIRRKITRWYRKLYAIDAQVDAADRERADALLAEIGAVEQDVLHLTVPLGFADQLYNLRAHITLVRERVRARRAKLSGAGV